MAAKKVGALVKEARTAAGLTQEKLAKAAGENLTAADISKCEQGKVDLTTAQLKKIAVICGVTQSSLMNAPKNISVTAKKAAAAKTATAKTSTAKTASAAKKNTTAAKKTTAKTSTASKTTSKKTTTATPANATISLKVTSAEQKLIQAYRASTSDRKKAALKLLNGDYGDTIDQILSVTNSASSSSSSSSSGSTADVIGEMLGNVIGGLFGGK